MDAFRTADDALYLLRFDSGGNSTKSTNIGLIIGALVGALVVLILIIFLSLFAYHKLRRSISLFASWGVSGATDHDRSRNRGRSGVYGVPNIAPSSSSTDPRKLSPLQLSTSSSFGPSTTAASFASHSPVDQLRSPPMTHTDWDMRQMRAPYYETASSFASTPSTPITPSAPPTPSSPTPLMMYPPSPSSHLDALDYSPYVIQIPRISSYYSTDGPDPRI